jgi:hypothetical protein
MFNPFIKKLTRKTIRLIGKNKLKEQKILKQNLLRITEIAFWAMLNSKYIFSDNRKLYRLKNLKKSAKFTKALLIANGPSVNSLDWTKVNKFQQDGAIVFAINYFPLHDFGLNSRIIPNNLVLSDLEHSPENLGNERTKNLWKWIENHPQVNLFLPCDWEKILSRNTLIANRIYFFQDRPLENFGSTTNPTKFRRYVSMTAYKSIAIAEYLDFNEIFLIGYDNNNFMNIEVDENNCLIQHPSHFFPYGGPVNLSERLGFDTAAYFLDLSRVFAALRLFDSTKIFNLDSSSLIDNFKKIPNFLS